MYNQGDTITFLLDYTIDETPLSEYNPDEIEFSIGEKRYTLTNGDIGIDESSGKYAVSLSQADSFNMGNVTKYQIRIKKDGEVVSSGVERILLGSSISRTEI